MKPRPTERITLHLRLGRLAGTQGLHVAVAGRRFTVREHSPESLAAHASTNAALEALGHAGRAGFTHFAEEVEVPSDMAVLLRVAYPSPDGARVLPELAMLHVHIPRAAREAHLGRKPHADVIRDGPRFWARRLPSDEVLAQALRASLDAHYLLTSQSTATAILFQHPQFFTSDQHQAQVITADHINGTANLTNMARFAGAISHQGTGWQTQKEAVTHSGQTLEWGPGFSQTGTVYAYQLSAQTVEAAAAPLAMPLATTQDDPALKNSVWSLASGTPSTPAAQGAQHLARARTPRTAASAVGTAIDGYDFALANRTPGYGLTIDGSSLQFTPGTQTGTGTMSINVLNTYLRSLYAWIGFEDAAGTSLGPPTPISLVTPVNVVLGIPMPTDPTTLTFDWPEDASTAILSHGGLGTSNWNNDIVWPGVIMTGVFNYGIPVLFMVAGALLGGDGELNEIEKDDEVQKTVQDLGMSIFGAAETNSIGFDSVSTIFTALADGIAGFLVHAGLESLQEWIVEELTETAFEDAIPYVDIAFQIANRAVDLVEIGETTVEVLLSPAVYTAEITRAMPLALQVGPDPTHGIWPQDASTYQAIVQYQGGTFFTENGPLSGAASAQPIEVGFASVPAGGNIQGKLAVYAADGTLLGQWSGPWVPAIPPQDGTTLTLVGAIQEVLVPLTADTVYQYKQKLVYNAASQAHMWQPNQFSLPSSEAANLDAATIDAATRAAFQSNGITLDSTASVQVETQGSAWNIADGASSYNLVAVSQGGADYIQVNTYNAPLAVLPLDPSDQGNNLGALVNVTINDRAYMLGYTWQASGQDVPQAGSSGVVTSQIYTFQNVNVLADPEVALKFSGCGFGNQPFLVYDQFGPEALFSASADTFETDLDNGTIDAGLVQLFAQFGYTLPPGATAAVVTSGAEWTIASGSTVLYQLNRLTDQINVYPFPTAPISQNNFYLEPVPISQSGGTSYRYQVRQVTLDDTTPFPMQASVSFGQFLLPALNDAAVHPQGYVIGAHADANVLEVLQLPSTPASDASAVAAVIVGGGGTRAGLFNQPTALTVTADGRVLVLEQGNARIQAVDVNGNPVYCFAGQSIGSASASACSGLDQGLVSSDLRTAFADAAAPLSAIWRVQDGSTIFQFAPGASSADVVVTSAGNQLSSTWTITDSASPTAQVFTCVLDGQAITVSDAGGQALYNASATDAQRLNSGAVPADIKAGLAAKGITLVNPLSVAGNGLSLPTSDLAYLMAGTIPPDLAGSLSARGFTLSASATVSSNVVVQVETTGTSWTLTDPAGPATYGIVLDGQAATILPMAPFVPLQAAPDGTTLTYGSIGTELKGYIYTLGYVGDGTAVTDFCLDIYQPDGVFLTRTSGVNAGKMTVDFWRDVYSLNFESFLGPNGRTEPSVSTWTPSV